MIKRKNSRVHLAQEMRDLNWKQRDQQASEDDKINRKATHVCGKKALLKMPVPHPTLCSTDSEKIL